MMKMTGAVLLAGFALAAPAFAADAPAEIKIGTLYASSGRYASISMPVFSALKLWADQKNADGGVYIKAFDKKFPVKLVAYDDQSNTATASTLYNQLITQDKVDLLVADSGSVLTAPAVAIARDHKMFLFDQTGTGASFFSKDNPYIALMADPVSTVWPKPVADFISHDGPGLGIKKIAILYSTNEFTGTQANAFRKFVKDSGAPIEIVYDQGVPTETTNYTVIINNINNTQPDAVIHFPSAFVDALDKAHRTGGIPLARATSITGRIEPSRRCTSPTARASRSCPCSMVSIAVEKRAKSLSPGTPRSARRPRIRFT